MSHPTGGFTLLVFIHAPSHTKHLFGGYINLIYQAISFVDIPSAFSTWDCLLHEQPSMQSQLLGSILHIYTYGVDIKTMQVSVH